MTTHRAPLIVPAAWLAAGAAAATCLAQADAPIPALAEVAAEQPVCDPLPPFLQVILALGEFPLLVGGPHHRDGAALEGDAGHQGAEAPDVGPVEGHQQGLLAAAKNLGHHAPHGVAHLHAVVGHETPGAFDAMLGRDGTHEAAADLRETDAGGAERRRHQFTQWG